MNQHYWQRTYEPAPKGFELSIAGALQQTREEKNMKRFTLRTAMAAMAVLAALTGVSLALARNLGAPDVLSAVQPLPLEMALDTPGETQGASDEELIEDAAERLAAWRALGAKAPEKKPQLKLYAFSLPDAEIEILSPHIEGSLDLNNLRVDGSFSFVATFPNIGDNEVIIRAQQDGREAILTHMVCYVPPASIYAIRSWSLEHINDYMYLVNNPKQGKGQVYVCKGIIKEIMGDHPQTAIMEIGINETEQPIFLENNSATVWEAGRYYRMYGEAFGLHETMPRLIVRYTDLN